MAKKKAINTSDPNQKAKSIVDIATNETKDTISAEEAKTAAQKLGRLGGLKGGKARAKALSAKRRSEIAKAAARARWGRKE